MSGHAWQRCFASGAALAALGVAAGCGSTSAPETASPRADPVTSAAGAVAKVVVDQGLTAGVTVGPTCAVTGFAGVVPNAKGDQCNPANLKATPEGLAITSSAGQLANGDQQNALFDRFDGSAPGWEVHATLKGPIDTLTKNYQQIALWFGPDSKNFVKVEAEHGNGSGPDPHLTMFWEEDGKAVAVGIVSLPALTTSKTVDLFIRADDAHGITVAYSLDGEKTSEPVGRTKTPVDVASWFSREATTGVLVSNTGSTTPITAVFTRFQITTS